MAYRPNLDDIKDEAVARELIAISEAFFAEVELLRMQILNAEPDKIRDGAVIFADGTNFDPGSGAGIYARISGAWVKL